MVTSRYATLHDIELILDEAEKGNAETRWNFTFDRYAAHDHVRIFIENDTSDILIVERDGGKPRARWDAKRNISLPLENISRSASPSPYRNNPTRSPCKSRLP